MFISGFSLRSNSVTSSGMFDIIPVSFFDRQLTKVGGPCSLPLQTHGEGQTAACVDVVNTSKTTTQTMSEN